MALMVTGEYKQR